MSSISIAHSGNLGLASPTVRQFRWVLFLTATLVALGSLIYVVERYVLDLERRFVENPVEIMMRAFAMAHFTLGWLFLFSSPRIRNSQAILRLGITGTVGLLLCLVFAKFGSISNPLLAFFFYGYFLVHEVRDETVIYQAYGDMPQLTPLGKKALNALSRSVCISLMGLLLLVYLLHVAITGKSGLDNCPRALMLGLSVLLLIACTWSWRQTWLLGISEHGDARSFIQAHAPLWWVYLGIAAVLVLGSLLGATGINLVIVIHVASWLVFVHYKLSAHKPKEASDPWTWLRETPAGFLTLHLAVFVGFLILLAVRVYVWQRAGVASQLLASDTFCYWSLMHISMAFWSSK